jgi:hypothetical protein
MKYTVRNADGSLEFENIHALADAYRMGMVDSDDEVQEQGKTLWRKAGAIPALVSAKKQQPSLLFDRRFLGIFVAVATALLALVFFQQGQYLLGGVAAVAVMLSTNRIANSFKTRPFGR